MKQGKHTEEAARIGADSYVLLHFVQLPRNASVARQVLALKADMRWQNNHQEEVNRRLASLIADIENTATR